jgi:beta-glucosidase
MSIPRWRLLTGAAVLLLVSLVLVAPSAHAALTLLSQGRPTTASSTENAGSAAANATDGNDGTRWSSAFADPQWLQVDLGAAQAIAQVSLHWETARAATYKIQVSTDGAAWTDATPVTTGVDGTQTLTLAATGRYVRMYGLTRSTQYGYSLWEFQVFGGSAPTACSTGNSAQGRPTTASSAENAGTPAGSATDGNDGTRWASAFADPQWLQVDLGSSQQICGVELHWEAAYATAFQIQISLDATSWTTVYGTTTAAGGNQSLTVSGSGRYVRMSGRRARHSTDTPSGSSSCTPQAGRPQRRPRGARAVPGSARPRRSRIGSRNCSPG